MVEALQSGPSIKRARDAGFPIGNIVVLAEEGGAVAVLAQISAPIASLFGICPL
jgi:hypothetical protein